MLRVIYHTVIKLDWYIFVKDKLANMRQVQTTYRVLIAQVFPKRALIKPNLYLAICLLEYKILSITRVAYPRFYAIREHGTL